MSVIKEFVKDKVSLTFKERDIIIKGGWLEDDHMEKFGFLVKKSSNYIPQEPWKVQLPHNIEPVPEDKEHIQILHSADDLRNQQSDGHWVLCYYDKKRIYIYDSLNKRKVHTSHKIYLNHLFPNYPFDKKPVVFPEVQRQQNGSDCGVFAITFAVSLLYRLKPETVRYNDALMRQHLLKMFETNVIKHFPRIL